MSGNFDEMTRRLEAAEAQKQQQPASSSDASVKCNGCGVLLDDKYMLPSHIKRVHMKVGGSVTLIACPTPQCSYRHLSQEKIFMHINDVHYKKQGGNDGSDAGRPAPESAETPAASIHPSHYGAKLASGSFGQKLPQTGQTGSVITPKITAIPSLIPIPDSTSGTPQPKFQTQYKPEFDTSDDPEIVEIIETPVKGVPRKEHSAQKQSLAEGFEDSGGQKTHSEERKPHGDQNMEDKNRVRIEMQKGGLICYKCNKVFSAKQKYNIIGHIKGKHLDMKAKYEKDSESNFTRCPFCPFESEKQTKLILHINDEHYKKDSNAIVTINPASEVENKPDKGQDESQGQMIEVKDQGPKPKQQGTDSRNDDSSVQNPKPPSRREGVNCYKCSQFFEGKNKHSLPMHIKATHLKLARDATLPEGKCPFCPFQHPKQARVYFHINETHYKQTSGEPSTASPSQEMSAFASKDPSNTEPVKRKREFSHVTCFKCGKSMPPLGCFVLHVKAHFNKGKDEPLDRCPICDYSGKKVAAHINEEHFRGSGGKRDKMEVDADNNEEFPSLALESGEESEQPNNAAAAKQTASRFQLAAKKASSLSEWRCSICPTKFTLKYDLGQHVKKQHLKFPDQPWRKECHKCGFRSWLETDVMVHYSSEHLEQDRENMPYNNQVWVKQEEERSGQGPDQGQIKVKKEGEKEEPMETEVKPATEISSFDQHRHIKSEEEVQKERMNSDATSKADDTSEERSGQGLDQGQFKVKKEGEKEEPMETEVKPATEISSFDQHRHIKSEDEVPTERINKDATSKADDTSEKMEVDAVKTEVSQPKTEELERPPRKKELKTDKIEQKPESGDKSAPKVPSQPPKSGLTHEPLLAGPSSVPLKGKKRSQVGLVPIPKKPKKDIEVIELDDSDEEDDDVMEDRGDENNEVEVEDDDFGDVTVEEDMFAEKKRRSKEPVSNLRNVRRGKKYLPGFQN